MICLESQYFLMIILTFIVKCAFGREDSPMTEVEPYIPFNINPSGMQPVLTTSYLLAFPSILAGYYLR